MKTALILSGQIRGARDCYANTKKNLIDQYDADVFISTWTPTSNVTAALGNTYTNDISMDEMFDMYKPKACIIEEFDTLPMLRKLRLNIDVYNNKTAYDGTWVEETNIENVFLQNFRRAQGFELLHNYSNDNGVCYERVILSRFDLDIHTFPIIEPENNEIWIPTGPNADSPEYHYGGIRDLMAIGGQNEMSYYCDLYNHLNFYVRQCEFGLHPESIIRRHLERYGFKIKRFPMESSLRGNPVL